jgi:beta-1,4-mannosyltransferase
MEIFFGRKSDYNLCVTNSMRHDLATYGIKAFTLYDKPHERFQPLKIEDKHSFYLKLAQNYNLKELVSAQYDNTLFTESIDGQIKLKKNRPALIVSCSSWTEDEDFHLLFEALKKYQKEITGLPDLVCILTGKGPLKQYYENLFASENFSKIKIKFLWLESQDYPLLLGNFL